MSTKAQREGGEKGRKKGFANEAKFANLLCGIKPEKNRVDSVIKDAKYAINKVDLIIDGEKCSLKTSGNSTQIQVCELTKFVEKFRCSQDIINKMYKFFGADFKKKKKVDQSGEFTAKCDEWGIDVSKLNSELEVRRLRLLANNIDGFDDVIKWLKSEIREVVRFILSTGFCKNEDNHAKYLLWSIEEADNDNCDADIFVISEILNKCNEWDVSVRKSQSVIEIGPFTLQMKGSGSGSGYHCMQFNTSLKDLNSYMDK